MQGNATLPKGRIDKHFRQGVLFVTYSLLVSNAKSMGDENADGSSNAPIDMAIPAGSRLAQIVDWLKGDEEPLIILDECHKAKNLVAPGGEDQLDIVLLSVSHYCLQKATSCNQCYSLSPDCFLAVT